MGRPRQAGHRESETLGQLPPSPGSAPEPACAGGWSGTGRSSASGNIGAAGPPSSSTARPSLAPSAADQTLDQLHPLPRVREPRQHARTNRSMITGLALTAALRWAGIARAPSRTWQWSSRRTRARAPCDGPAVVLVIDALCFPIAPPCGRLGSPPRTSAGEERFGIRRTRSTIAPTSQAAHTPMRTSTSCSGRQSSRPATQEPRSFSAPTAVPMFPMPVGAMITALARVIQGCQAKLLVVGPDADQASEARSAR